MIVGYLEMLAQRIGLTIDNTYEALLWTFAHAQAQANACDLSSYARAVFHVVCSVS